MTYEWLWRQLADVYDEGEAKAIIRYLLEDKFGLSAADIYCGRVEQIDAAGQRELQHMVDSLRQCVPVQYVTGTACFCGREFRVGPGVLIPRPETEDLCAMIIRQAAESSDASQTAPRPTRSILDIGTGSGCIAITLAKDIAGSSVSAWDISPDALQMAAANADRLGACVHLTVQDALCPPADTERWDIIVSNPPYICMKEQAAMHPNVLRHEPHTALFVPDDNPLLFYRAIAGYAIKALRPGGRLWFELNPDYAAVTAEMLRGMGFHGVDTVCDRFGRLRFAVAARGQGC